MNLEEMQLNAWYYGEAEGRKRLEEEELAKLGNLMLDAWREENERAVL